MFKITVLFKKIALVVLVLVLGLAFLPSTALRLPG